MSLERDESPEVTAPAGPDRDTADELWVRPARVADPPPIPSLDRPRSTSMPPLKLDGMLSPECACYCLLPELLLFTPSRPPQTVVDSRLWRELAAAPSAATTSLLLTSSSVGLMAPRILNLVPISAGARGSSIRICLGVSAASLQIRQRAPSQFISLH